MTSDAVFIAIVAATPGTIAGVAALVAALRNGKKVDNLSIEVDGRLTELLKERGISSHAIGKAEGKVEERAEESERQTHKLPPITP